MARSATPCSTMQHQAARREEYPPTRSSGVPSARSVAERGEAPMESQNSAAKTRPIAPLK
jgi:hypothetical protein